MESTSPPSFPDATLARWSKALDHRGKGYISASDIIDASYFCGLEVSIPDLTSVTSLAPSLRPAASLQLFADFDCSLESAEELIAYWRHHRMVFRPDNFLVLTHKQCMLSRTLGYVLVPFLNMFLQHRQIPRFSEYEEAQYSILMRLMCTFCTFAT
jgi:hypothetical protein